MSMIHRRLSHDVPGKNLLVCVLCLSLVFGLILPVSGAKTNARTEMTHNPPDYFVPDYRLQLDVSVGDPAGVNLVRCYFKAAGEADFVFVPMTRTGGSDNAAKYSGVLPAPSAATKVIKYLFLAVNSNNVVVRSQEFSISGKAKSEPPAWQKIPKKGDIQVSMELDKVPSELRGFTDNIVMNRVESGARFGLVVGGLYYLTRDNAAHTTGAAASASSAGTVTAAAAGYSTAVLVGAGIAGAAAVGGAAAAASGGGGGGSSDDHHSGDTGSDLPGGTGEVKVTLQWSDCNDLDLTVKDPCGNNIYFGNKSAVCDGRTGTLDVDANALTCAPSPAENIYWTTAPRGSYSVSVNYFSGSGTSFYTVTTIVGGERRTYTGSISSGTRTITSFTY